MGVLETEQPVGQQYQIETTNGSPLGVRVASSGGGGSLVNLYNTVWVDKNTTVAPADQTGNIEAPFDSLADGRTALIALANGDEKMLVVQPGDYSAEAAFAWDSTADGRLNVVNGSWLGLQQQQSIQNVTFPTIDFPGGLGGGLNNLTGIVFGGNVTGAAALNLTSCQQLAGTFAADRVDATNCYLNGAQTLSGSGHIYRQCATGDIDLSANEADLQFQDTVCAGDVTWLGDPGEALFDDTSLRWLIATGKKTVNGTARLSRPPTCIMTVNVEEPNNPFFDTSATTDTFLALTALITDFLVDGNGFTLAANGVLTYAGPKRHVMVRGSFTLGNLDATNVPTAALGVSLNGDLNGLAIGVLASVQAGVNYVELTNQDEACVSFQRRLTISDGDTISLSGAAGFSGLPSDIQLFSGSLTIDPVA